MRPRRFLFLICAMLLASVSTHAQQWDWVQRFSGDGTVGTQVGVDDAQNVYVAGTFSGTNYIGTNRIASDTGDNLFIAKFDPFGVPLWTIPASGTLTKMLVASNGSVFVCGVLAFNAPATISISNIFLARIDEANVTWTEPLPDGVGHAASMAFGPDETIHVLGSRPDQSSIQRFTQSGGLLGVTPVQVDPATPFDISMAPAGQPYVEATFTTNSNGTHIRTSLVAPLSSAGEPIWVQDIRGGLYEDKQEFRTLATTPDSGVVLVSFSKYRYSQGTGIRKYSATGTLEWGHGFGSPGKGGPEGQAVVVDARGYVHFTGNWWPYYIGTRLWGATISPTGSIVHEFRVASYQPRNANAGKAIAADRDGAIFVTGTLEGTAIFGTNWVTVGSRSGFVARRSTLVPELTQEPAGANVVLSWQHAAFPLALQQSTDETNWSFVTVPPLREGWRYRAVLPNVPGTTFRLLRTNDPPFNHSPQIYPLSVPAVAFLDHPHVLIAGNTVAPASSLAAYFDDLDEQVLTVAWTNLQTGEPMTNRIAITRVPGRDDWNYRYPPYYQASVALDVSMFLPGRHAVSISVSDGTSTVTANYPEFEVISFESALAEFEAALNALRNDRAGQHAIAYWEGWRRATDRERPNLAEKRWLRFKRQLARVTTIDEEERGKLSDAADLLKPFLALL